MNKNTYILGAGLGGMSAAIWQALAGREVTMLEKNTVFGGKVAMHSGGGYTFDIGPTLLTMPFVFEELFEAAGEKFSDYVDLYKIDPICRYFWSDGSVLDAVHSVSQMKDNLSNLSKIDSERYKDYLEYSKEIYDLTAETFLFSPFSRARDFFNFSTAKLLPNILKLDAWRSVHKANSSFFNDTRIRQLFDRYATYNGSNPYSAPATLNIITHVEYGLGSYAIRGGMRKLGEAMYMLARKVGVKFRFGESIGDLVTNNRRISAIITDQSRYDSSEAIVISNIDVVETYRHYIGSAINYSNKLQKLEPSLSGLIICWGIEGRSDELALHNIFFSDDYHKEFKQIFEDRSIPDDPTYYISISSRHSERDAPQGFESWFILVNAPYISQDNQDTKDRNGMYLMLKEKLLGKLKQSGIDVSGRIRYEYYIDQQRLYDRYGSNKGSIYGISSNSQLAAFKRPPNNDPNFDNLFFAGGSSHPGGGMPLVSLSGKHASTLAMDYLSSKK